MDAKPLTLDLVGTTWFPLITKTDKYKLETAYKNN